MRKIILAVAGVVAGGLVAVAFQQAKAQPQAYEFWIAGNDLSVSIDRVIAAGKVVGLNTITSGGATTCTAGGYPMQGVVVIATNGSGGTRHYVSYLAPGTAIPSATKMGSISVLGSCYDATQAATWYQYQGTVQ